MSKQNKEIKELLLIAIKELYHEEGAGGALHIVLDDDNLDDEYIDFCEKFLHNEYRQGIFHENFHEEFSATLYRFLYLRQLHTNCIRLMRYLSVPQRKKVIKKFRLDHCLF